MFAVEAMVRLLLEEGDEGRKIQPQSIERARRVLSRIVSATVHGEGPRIAPMPKLDD